MRNDCFEWFKNLTDSNLKSKITDMMDVLKSRCDAGEHIPRTHWSNVSLYKVFNNLWRYEIDDKARAVYTIIASGQKLIVLIVEIFPDHKSYERRFGY